MGGIAGCAGVQSAGAVEGMLEAIDYRGDGNEIASVAGATFGLRTWRGRADGALSQEGGLAACASASLPALTPAALAQRLAGDAGDLDGAFAVAAWDPATETLTLARDAFGQRALYYVCVGDVLWFASELKQLLAVPDLAIELDVVAVHKYLTFSFVPGDATPIQGVSRLPPGHVLTWRRGQIETRPWFTLAEHIAPVEQAEAAKALWRLGRQAVARRLGEASGTRAGLYLSGGIDSSAIGLWLKDLGADVTALTLDFGANSVDREEATAVASHLGVPLQVVPVDPDELRRHLRDVLWQLDLPFGDPVTGPQWLLGQAARAAGITSVWNGEGGDQLFGGWTSKPMVAAAVYGGHAHDGGNAPEEQYLKSYHKFYGSENELYAPALADRVTAGERRQIIGRYLGTNQAQTFLNRVRLTDLSLKGSQNILPRAEHMAAAHGLDLHMPLFDRRLAEWSFTLPPGLKLHGACEKYVFKLALQGRLPDDIVWRRKFGMSVPVTDWVLGALRPVVDEVLSDEAVRRRGLFRVEFVRSLREGHDVASETRRRRLGERLWALLVLEVWCRRFIDREAAP